MGVSDEMVSGLLVPTERPPLALDIKRALLTFDTVELLDPGDRDIIDPSAFYGSIVPMAVFRPGPPVLPLGKIPSYDVAFAQTIEECAEALDQGTVVLSRPPALSTDVIIGWVPPRPTGWADPRDILELFGIFARRPELLRGLLKGLPSPRDVELDSLVLRASALDVSINDRRIELPDLNDGSVDSSQAQTLARLAAARLGAVIKCMGICSMTGVHPISTDAGVSELINEFQRQSSETLAAGMTEGSVDADTVRRALRVERIVFKNHLPDERLSKLTVKEVLRLRTKAWGTAGVARARFFKTVRQIADDEGADERFDTVVKTELANYAKTQADLRHELTKFGLKIGLGAMGGAAAAMKDNVLQGLLGMPDWGLALSVVAATALYAKELTADVANAIRQRKDGDATHGKALVRPYQFALR